MPVGGWAFRARILCEVLHMRQHIFILLLLLGITACSKHEDVPASVFSAENTWILDSMRMYYYWENEIPGTPQSQQDATHFFTGLLSAKDRFSYIADPTNTNVTYSAFAWYGFEYAIVQLSNTTTGVITLVVPGSPAAKKGLQRGQYFTAVNNTVITAQNAAQVKDIFARGGGATLQMAQEQSGTLTNTTMLTVTHSNFNQQPVYAARVYSNGNNKAGYLFYNAFDGQYDKLLTDSIKKLQNAGISSLIIDARYNPGGDVATAAKFCAMLTNVGKDAPFITYKANKNGGTSTSTVEETIRETSYTPSSFAALSSYHLSLNKIVILTTRNTASAAEALINCLKPYITTIQVGDTTLGKDMGSFAIWDQRTPKTIPYTLYPLIFKLYNAQGKGDYNTGIAPDYYVNEFASFPLLPFGDMNDPALQKALSLTTGLPATALNRMSRTARPAANVLYQSAIAAHNSPVITSHTHWKKR